MTGIKKVLNNLMINILWVVFSIPVITLGGATSAAFYVNLKLSENSEESVFSLFIKSFKENFLQGFLASIFSVITLGGVSYFWYWLSKDFSGHVALVVVNIVLTLLMLSMNIMIYSQIAHYNNKLSNIIKNSFAFSLTFMNFTIKMSIFVALEILVQFFLFKFNLIAGFVSLLFWPQMIFYTITLTTKKILNQLDNSEVFK